MNIMKLKLLGAIVLVFSLLYACNEVSTTDNQENLKSGNVIIKLTDAPFPEGLVDSVLVTIDWVKLKKVEEGSEDEMESDTFITLNVDQTVDLLALSNGVSLDLGEVDVPVGNYSEMRMHVTEATVFYSDYDGVEKSDVIKIPSGNTSGLKIKISPALEVDGFNSAVVLIDFDASRSFLVKGNPEKNGKEITGFKFKPVIRAVALAHTGEVSGVVQDTMAGTESEVPQALSGAELQLIYNGGSSPDTISALSGEDGTYKIIGVPKGEYVLNCGKETHDTLSQTIIIEIDGDIVDDANFILTKPEVVEETANAE